MKKEDKSKETIEIIGFLLAAIPVMTLIIYGIVKAFMLQLGFGIVVVGFGMFTVGCILLHEER